MSASAARRTVLMVEDDPVYAEFVISSVGRAGLPFEVRHVSSVDDALAYVRGEGVYEDRAAHPMPEIVLLDINLGQKRGFPVLRWLRENGYLEEEKVRVVML